MTYLGVFAGGEPAGVTQFETWLGRKVDFCSVFTGEASWQDFDDSPPYQLSHFAGLGRALALSVPLIPAGATLTDAAAGHYNAHYRRAAAAVVAARPEPVIYVRTGWEQNGDWMKWAAHGKERAFNEAFRQFATCFRAASDRVRLVWCPCVGQHDPALSYPGDDVVDVIAIDAYHQPQWDPKGPIEAWSYMVTRRYGLQWHLEFARAHRKPTAFPEWGVSTDGFGSYIEHMAEWFRAGNVLFQTYWDSNSSYPGQLSGGQYPRTGAAFRAAFNR